MENCLGAGVETPPPLISAVTTEVSESTAIANVDSSATIRLEEDGTAIEMSIDVREWCCPGFSVALTLTTDRLHMRMKGQCRWKTV